MRARSAIFLQSRLSRESVWQEAELARRPLSTRFRGKADISQRLSDNRDEEYALQYLQSVVK
jgi:hypothetical protein